MLIRIIRTASNNYAILTIVFIATFFRFFRNDFLQYWNNDEEIHAATVLRMIKNGRPSLVSPQPTLGTSIGSIFHIASVPLFQLTDMDQTKVAAMFSLTGLLTTLAIFVLGKEVRGEKLGLLAAFLYASSFLTSLYDRRWWPITLTPLLTAIALISAIKLARDKWFRGLPLLVLLTATSLHGDPAMIAIGLFTLITIIGFRLRIPYRYYLASTVIFIFFISPLAVFEFKHPGALIEPMLTTISRKQKQEMKPTAEVLTHSASLFSETTKEMIFPEASAVSEKYFFGEPVHQTSTARNIISAAVIGLVLFPLLRLKKSASSKERAGLTVIASFLIIFTFGVLLFELIYQHEFQRVYMTLLFPIIFLLLSWTLLFLTTKWKWLLRIAVLAYLAMNIRALTQSRLRFPLPPRQQAVRAASEYLEGNNFSLYVMGDSYLVSSGMTYLFTLNGHTPKKSYLYPPLDWLLRSHSLYFVEPTEEDQEKIVIIAPKKMRINAGKHLIYHQDFDLMSIAVFDNGEKWFKERNMVELISS